MSYVLPGSSGSHRTDEWSHPSNLLVDCAVWWDVPTRCPVTISYTDMSTRRLDSPSLRSRRSLARWQPCGALPRARSTTRSASYLSSCCVRRRRRRGGGVGASVWTVRVLEWCSARTLQIPERQARSVDDTLHSTTSRQCLGWGLIT